MQFATLLIGVQRQVEHRGAALPLQWLQGQLRGQRVSPNICHLRLVVVHHLEQRCTAGIALKLERFNQLFER
ncbi:hypothetical protein D3C75_1254260 [compost metagenome]